VTGLLYHDTSMATADEAQNLVDKPLCDLDENQIRPSPDTLENINSSFRG